MLSDQQLPPDGTPSRSTPEASSDTAAVLDGYMRRDELATALGISPRTIDRWHAHRQGPPRIQIGRTILYERHAVRAWLRSRERNIPVKSSRKR